MCQNGHEFVVLLTCFAWNITESTTKYTVGKIVFQSPHITMNKSLDLRQNSRVC